MNNICIQCSITQSTSYSAVFFRSEPTLDSSPRTKDDCTRTNLYHPDIVLSQYWVVSSTDPIGTLQHHTTSTGANIEIRCVRTVSTGKMSDWSVIIGYKDFYLNRLDDPLWTFKSTRSKIQQIQQKGTK